MHKRNDLNSFTPKHLERHRSESRFGEFQSEELLPRQRSTEVAIEPLDERGSLMQGRDLLATEIKRGKEYLERIQKELNDSRSSLEHWSRYEQICSAHPLDHLIEVMSLQEKTQQFLIDWLQRQEQKRATIVAQLEALP